MQSLRVGDDELRGTGTAFVRGAQRAPPRSMVLWSIWFNTRHNSRRGPFDIGEGSCEETRMAPETTLGAIIERPSSHVTSINPRGGRTTITWACEPGHDQLELTRPLYSCARFGFHDEDAYTGFTCEDS